MNLKICLFIALLLSAPLSTQAAETCVSLLGKDNPIFTNAEKLDWQVWQAEEPVRIKTVMDNSLGAQDITVGRAKFPKLGDGLPYHRHSHAELYKIISGQAKIIIDGVDYTATQGQVVILPGNAMHTIINDSDNLLEIEYYFPSNSLHNVGYEYPEDLTSTQAFSAALHKQYVVSPNTSFWKKGYIEGIATKNLVTEADQVDLTFSQLQIYSNSEPLKVKLKNAQVISVKSGAMSIKINGVSRELKEGEMVFAPVGSNAIITPVGGKPLELDIVTRDL